MASILFGSVIGEPEGEIVIHHQKSMRAFLVAVLLSVAAPAAIHAADRAPLATSPAATTPLDQNLLQNPGFEQTPSSPIPGWTVVGDVHVEKFGTRAWPTKAYLKKWQGGKRYLACGTNSGLVRQTVSFDRGSLGSPLKVRLDADFGGTIGHKIRVFIKVTGSGPDKTMEKVRVNDITNSYKRAVATLSLPLYADHIEATVELMPKSGATSCKIVADSIGLVVFRP